MSSGRVSAATSTSRHRWPVAGRADVAFYPGERQGAERTARRMFGRNLNRREYAGLAGAPDGANVDVGSLGDELYIESREPATTTYRAVQRISFTDSAPVVSIDAFHILARSMQRKGLGLEILARQISYAKHLGVRCIETTAGRYPSENGYYTWPRFGFNGPLPESVKQKLSPGLGHAREVLDLIETQSGRRWWIEHGVTLHVVFDLSDQSRSWKMLHRYLAARG